MTLATLHDVFTAQIDDLYSAENQLIAALPKLAAAAADERLREALASHFQETRAHVERLAQIKEEHGIPPRGAAAAWPDCSRTAGRR